MWRKKKPLSFFLIVNFLVLVLSIIVSINYFADKKNRNIDGDVKPQVLAATELAEEKRFEDLQAAEDVKTLSVLLLGYGGPGHQGGMLTDVIQLAYIDVEKAEINLISIPRDLWVSLPNGQAAKINRAFSMSDADNAVESGSKLAKHMVHAVTGLPVDYFVAIDFVGFQRLIGYVLEGIEVEVAETLEDPWYPITGKEQDPCDYTPEEIAALTNQYSGFELESKFECRYEHLLFNPGKVKMEGGDALKYVRSRHGSAGGDFSRSRRQQEVLEAMKKKFLSLGALKNAPQFFEQAKYTFTSDFDVKVIAHLATALKNLGQFKVKEINLNTDNVFKNGKSSSGQFIVLPKEGLDEWNEVRKYVGGKLEG